MEISHKNSIGRLLLLVILLPGFFGHISLAVAPGENALKRWSGDNLLELIDSYIDFYTSSAGDDGVVRSGKIWCAETSATYDLAMMQAVRYTMDKDPQRAEAVLKILDFTASKYSPPGSGWEPLSGDFQRYFQIFRAAYAYLQIRDFEGISPSRHEEYKRLFVRNADCLAEDRRLDLHETVMTGNQVSPGMACLGITAILYPDHPHVDRWMRKARAVEGQFLALRRDPEGSSGYSGLGNRYWMRYDELVNHPTRITDDILREIADYYLALIEPDGRMVEVGEADQYEGFTHAAELSRAAAQLRDGRYLYGLDLLLSEPDRDFRESQYFCYGILDAFRWNDDAVSRQMPAAGITIIHYQPPSDPQFGTWHNADVIVYRSDWTRNATYVMQNLSFLSHGQDAVNAILSLFAHGTRWVTDSGYHRSGPADHNGVVARLYRGNDDACPPGQPIDKYTIGIPDNSHYELAWGFGKPVFDYFLGEPYEKFPGCLRSAGTSAVYCHAVNIHFPLSQPCDLSLQLAFVPGEGRKRIAVSCNGQPVEVLGAARDENNRPESLLVHIPETLCRTGQNVLRVGDGSSVQLDYVTLEGQNLLLPEHPALPADKLTAPEYLQTCKSIGQSIPKYIGTKIEAHRQTDRCVLWQTTAPTDIYCYFQGNPGQHSRTVIMNQNPLFWVIIDRVAEAPIQQANDEIGLQVLHSWFINGVFDAGRNFCIVQQEDERFLWATAGECDLVFEHDQGYYWSPRVAVRAITDSRDDSQLVSLLVPLGTVESAARNTDSLRTDGDDYYHDPDPAFTIVAGMKALRGTGGGAAVQFRLGGETFIAGAGYDDRPQTFGSVIETDARAFLVRFQDNMEPNVDYVGGSSLEFR